MGGFEMPHVPRPTARGSRSHHISEQMRDCSCRAMGGRSHPTVSARATGATAARWAGAGRTAVGCRAVRGGTAGATSSCVLAVRALPCRDAWLSGGSAGEGEAEAGEAGSVG